MWWTTRGSSIKETHESKRERCVPLRCTTDHDHVYYIIQGYYAKRGELTGTLPMSNLPVPPSSNDPGGVFDDYPVDRKSCQLLGPTALVRFISLSSSMYRHLHTLFRSCRPSWACSSFPPFSSKDIEKNQSGLGVYGASMPLLQFFSGHIPVTGCSTCPSR